METGTIISALVRRQVKSLGLHVFETPDIVIALSNLLSPDCPRHE
jgi:hypothetical protein